MVSYTRAGLPLAFGENHGLQSSPFQSSDDSFNVQPVKSISELSLQLKADRECNVIWNSEKPNTLPTQAFLDCVFRGSFQRMQL